jgi:hypothetical protein
MDRKTKKGWQHQGDTWLNPDREFYVVEDTAPNFVSDDDGRTVEYLVMPAGGDNTAGFPVATFSTLEEAIAEADRRAKNQR